ncbi:hypothetical protein BDB00DRAFT_578984 [Zychaea mexicana]|uniref:uncharacterized protein n=1 Tax=Zychaea mexicana TaxID=64656 RepID=UPI0022FEA34E|nr:uncharacterized protein BDB00DRAFT_578984 [Zychaea mexicana]KAI9489907.1 hypothetical protein BDB00DRAFT_578984 [Zychaea mexicana]
MEKKYAVCGCETSVVVNIYIYIYIYIYANDYGCEELDEVMKKGHFFFFGGGYSADYMLEIGMLSSLDKLAVLVGTHNTPF